MRSIMAFQMSTPPERDIGLSVQALHERSGVPLGIRLDRVHDFALAHNLIWQLPIMCKRVPKQSVFSAAQEKKGGTWIRSLQSDKILFLNTCCCAGLKDDAKSIQRDLDGGDLGGGAHSTSRCTAHHQS